MLTFFLFQRLRGHLVRSRWLEFQPIVKLHELAKNKSKHDALEEVFEDVGYGHELWKYITRMRLEKGETLCRPGDPARTLYIVQQGKLSAYRPNDGSKVCSFIHGAYINEMAIFVEGIQPYRIIAEAAVTIVLAITSSALETLKLTRPDILLGLQKTVLKFYHQRNLKLEREKNQLEHNNVNVRPRLQIMPHSLSYSSSNNDLAANSSKKVVPEQHDNCSISSYGSNLQLEELNERVQREHRDSGSCIAHAVAKLARESNMKSKFLVALTGDAEGSLSEKNASRLMNDDIGMSGKAWKNTHLFSALDEGFVVPLYKFTKSDKQNLEDYQGNAIGPVSKFRRSSGSQQNTSESTSVDSPGFDIGSPPYDMDSEEGPYDESEDGGTTSSDSRAATPEAHPAEAQPTFLRISSKAEMDCRACFRKHDTSKQGFVLPSELELILEDVGHYISNKELSMLLQSFAQDEAEKQKEKQSKVVLARLLQQPDSHFCSRRIDTTDISRESQIELINIFLTTSSFFRNLENAISGTIPLIANLAELQVFHKGETITLTGAPANSMFVVVEGVVNIACGKVSIL